MADEKDEEIRLLRERLDRIENRQEPSNAPPRKQGGCAIAAVLGLLLVVGYCTATGSSPGTSDYASEPSWTPPQGYQVHDARGGGRIAVKWEKPTASECRGSGVTCYAMDVVTERGCPRNLYVSISLFNGTDNIGWTNDTAQGVQAGEVARLVFDSYERGIDGARVAEVSCY